MNIVQTILATFRKNSADAITEILKSFMNNSFEDKDIRHYAGRCNVHDSILNICNQIESQLKDGHFPDLNSSLDNKTNPSSAVRSTSISLDEVNG